MYKVTVLDEFNSAHFLRAYKGKCERLHGHNWKVLVSVWSERLNSTGMVIDFKDLKKLLAGVLKELDHRCLNELNCFKKVNPTSENIAAYVYDRIKAGLKSKKYKRLSVDIWETDSSRASFTEE
ncbi:MAG: 6-carboxytetrahydropterin synthase QueD [Candidatus Omnitrophica bacterium]|nr:6-carboxytetrahydropterin synthase QueD [Candidatus Omnitrophota bacterium]